MQAKLVATTQPSAELVEQGIKTAEQLITYCARVSSPDNQLNTDTGERLLRYCLKHGHVSVFETASMTVEIETSRAIAAQILRHRSFTFQEFSQRYADVSDLGFEWPGLRRQDLKNRQSSVDDYSHDEKEDWAMDLEHLESVCYSHYQGALAKGVAKEVARFLLPLSVKTRLYMTGSIRSFIHYLQARTAPETQLEHRQVAKAIKVIFTEQFPTVAKAVWAEGI